jgi:putative Mg2+ transporter-C (MgtC) family protein
MSGIPTHGVLSAAGIAVRLLAALGCGAVIGLNRDFHNKPAGFRTFGLVSLGSALVVLMMDQTPGTGPDAVSRVVQGVLTGIGFLGAGVILHRVQLAKVAGLTTAAAVWLTAGLGMAAGAGQLKLAGIGLLFGMLLLSLGGAFERLLERLLGGANGSDEEPRGPDHPDST